MSTSPCTPSILILETTFPSAEEATETSKILVSEKHAACAQIGSPIASLYIWKEQFEKEQEVIVSYKTSTNAKLALETRLNDLHPYEVPQILWKEVQSSTKYCQWVTKQTH